jgi:hypothetical protein
MSEEKKIKERKGKRTNDTMAIKVILISVYFMYTRAL